MQVEIQKVNGGIRFRALTASGKSRKTSIRVRKACAAAFEKYKQEALAVMEREGLAGSGYADTFKKLWIRMNDHRAGMFYQMSDFTDTEGYKELEIWGFASGSFQQPGMRDSGSTPTGFRAQFLLALQEPLTGDKFTKVYEVEG